MTITSATTIFNLVEEYPYLKDWLVAYDSHFESAHEPGAVRHHGAYRHARASPRPMAGVSEEQLLDDVRTEIAQHEIIAEETAGATRAPRPWTPTSRRDEPRRSRPSSSKLHDGVSGRRR